MAILLFLVVLFLLVLVHEFGHFWAAKKTGMRVDEFGIGFPPKLTSFKRGETEYSLNALPLGGFVRIHGEEAEDASARPSEESLERSEQRSPEGVQHRYGEDGSDESENTNERGSDRERSFSYKPKWMQALVLVAGIFANILFAWFLFSLAFWNGVLTYVSPEEATEDAQLYILDILPGSPAEVAGIPTNAVVSQLSREGQTIAPHTPDEFRLFIEESGDMPVTVGYLYKDKEASVIVVPATGVIEGSSTGAIGVSLGLIEIQSLPIHKAIFEGGKTTLTGLRDTVVGIFSLLGSAFIFEADLTAVAGPVGIVGLVADASALGFSTLLMFTALISLNLAVINILPFPALDGGRLLFVIIEAIKGSPIPARVAYYTNATGFAILILLMVAITYHDITKLV